MSHRSLERSGDRKYQSLCSSLCISPCNKMHRMYIPIQIAEKAVASDRIAIGQPFEVVPTDANCLLSKPFRSHKALGAHTQISI